ncbi:hypothetical protein G6F42_016509 [Rhizopus arrhizus]|nr:hypothetical protein G6F42_016509 [Rhizopus arrhizus]
MINPTITLQDLQDTDKANSIINQSIDQVLGLVKESRQWPVIYTHGDITTRKHKGPQHDYNQRSSIPGADQVTYDQLRSLLYLNHSLNETKYVKQLTDAILLQHVNDEADLFWLGFKTPVPSSNREFVELVATRENTRSFMVTSQPVAYTQVKQGYVRGAYEAWELVSEIENEQGDKVVEWICIQRSSAGGLIPRFMSDWVAAKDFHHDVEGIIKYIQNKSNQ